jgi:hypothetical protein
MTARGIWAIRSGDHKIVMQHRGGPPHPVSKTPRLVNLATDLKELTDHSTTDSVRFNELKASYDTWNAALPKPLWGPEPEEK